MAAPGVRWLRHATLTMVLLSLTFLVHSCSPGPGRSGPDPQSSNATSDREPAPVAVPQFFRLPTANLALFESGAETRYFVGTVGRSWTSGTFGCVRSEGYQFHEGLDIRWVERDASGEATDPILAAADGTVVYVNARSALSNYGIYVVLRHEFQGWELFTLYAHLARIDDRILPGLEVRCGDTLGVMGRTANTRATISKERAHLHFEISLLINERFPIWHRKHYPGQRDDHGIWNGRNLLGIDPRPVFLHQYDEPASFDFGAFLRQQPVLCRVLVRTPSFPWLDRYPATVETGGPTVETEIVAHELYLGFTGIPLRVLPRTAEEARGNARFQLLEVNAEVARGHPCQKLVSQRNGRWQFTTDGERFLDLLTF